MSAGLRVFQELCEVGTLLERWRDLFAPGGDEWTALTDMLGRLDSVIDQFVHSSGLGGQDDAEA